MCVCGYERLFLFKFFNFKIYIKVGGCKYFNLLIFFNVCSLNNVPETVQQFKMYFCRKLISDIILILHVITYLCSTTNTTTTQTYNHINVLMFSINPLLLVRVLKKGAIIRIGWSGRKKIGKKEIIIQKPNTKS